MYPDVGDQAFLDAALAMAHADGTDPTVRGALLGGSDNLVRRLRARGEMSRDSREVVMGNNSAGTTAGSGAIYGLGIFGAWVYYWQQADGFWEYAYAIFQGLFWPAYLVYEALAALGA